MSLLAEYSDPFSNPIDATENIHLMGIAIGESNKAAIIEIGKDTVVWQEGQENNTWILAKVTQDNVTLINKSSNKEFNISF